MKMASMTCSINPTVGREGETAIVPAGSPKKVLVVGGGPGGMEAARVAAARGHDVTLCEKEKELGGQLKVAAMVPMKQEIILWARYLARQVKKVGVGVELNTEVTAELIEGRKPDVVILASGSECCAPPIPGVDKANVVCSCEIFRQKVVPMQSNVLVVGGGSVGCEVADAMAGLGDNPLDTDNSVTIVEMLSGVAEDELPGARMLLRQRLRDKGVRIVTDAVVREITDDGAVFEKNAERQKISGMDHIVLACGARAVENLSNEIRDSVPEVHVIGDAKQPRRALEAIAEGAGRWGELSDCRLTRGFAAPPSVGNILEELLLEDAGRNAPGLKSEHHVDRLALGGRHGSQSPDPTSPRKHPVVPGPRGSTQDVATRGRIAHAGADAGLQNHRRTGEVRPPILPYGKSDKEGTARSRSEHSEARGFGPRRGRRRRPGNSAGSPSPDRRRRPGYRDSRVRCCSRCPRPVRRDRVAPFPLLFGHQGTYRVDPYQEVVTIRRGGMDRTVEAHLEPPVHVELHGLGEDVLPRNGAAPVRSHDDEVGSCAASEGAILIQPDHPAKYRRLLRFKAGTGDEFDDRSHALGHFEDRLRSPRGWVGDGKKAGALERLGAHRIDVLDQPRLRRLLDHDREGILPWLNDHGRLAPLDGDGHRVHGIVHHRHVLRLGVRNSRAGQ
jgi:thioredoxin reductase